MNNRTDIWRKLQDHEIPPPSGFDIRIRERLAHESDASLPSFEQLQDHTIQPPAGLQKAVLNKIGFKSGSSSSAGKILGITAVQKLRRRIAAVAAILIAVAIGALLLNRPEHSADNPITSSTSQITANSPQPAAVSDSNTAATPANTSDSTPTASASPVSPAIAASAAPSLNGQRFELVDNDLLLTFTSFRPGPLSDMLQQPDETQLHIRVDQYANIALSPSMSAMLKSLWQTRSNGKPTRKARKAKNRLEEWKEQDKKYFDGYGSDRSGSTGSAPNPIDPFDLLGFMINPGSKPPAAAAITGQPALPQPVIQKESEGDLTVSYQINVQSKRDNGIGETYNGGIKTLFAGKRHGRVRLVSLMRIQSNLVTMDKNRLQRIEIVKESGHRSVSRLNAVELTQFEERYRNASCKLQDDTMQILQYTCKKAVIKCDNGRMLTAWYTPALHKNLTALLEPVFAAIPGLVLRYETTQSKKTIIYSASSVSRRPIDENVFSMPGN